MGWVVVENVWHTGWSPPKLAVPVAYRDEDVTLYRVGGDHPAASNRGVMVAVHLVWLAALVTGLAGWAVGRLRSANGWTALAPM